MSPHDVRRACRALLRGAREKRSLRRDRLLHGERSMHPPYKEGGGRIEVRGHDGLAAFLGERGVTPARHEIGVVACQGANTFIEGVSRHGTPEPTLSFVSKAVVADDGRFRSYIAYATSRQPVVPNGGDADGRHGRSGGEQHDGGVVAGTHHVAETDSGVRDLARAGPAPQLLHQLVSCPSPDAPSGSPLDSRPPDRLTGSRPPRAVAPLRSSAPPHPARTGQVAVREELGAASVSWHSTRSTSSARCPPPRRRGRRPGR